MNHFHSEKIYTALCRYVPSEWLSEPFLLKVIGDIFEDRFEDGDISEDS